MGSDSNIAARSALPRDPSRTVRAYKVCALAAAVICGIWAILLPLNDIWLLAALNVVGVLACLLRWHYLRKGDLDSFLVPTQLLFLVLIIVTCLVYDFPTEAAPRVAHLYILPLGFLGFLDYRRRHRPVHLVVLGLCLLAFAALAGTNIAVPTSRPLPDIVRVHSAWLNALAAVSMLVGALALYTVELQKSSRMVRELEAALWHREFRLYYQPQVDGRGVVVGGESLIRWQHPERGLLSPGAFVPTAEQANLMGGIGHWVLEESCRTLAHWATDPALRHLALSVNVSASQFRSEGFETSVLELVRGFDIDPTKLKLELTESVMVSNADTVAAKMEVLRAAGIGISLDDFGTGYSSLAYLQKLPLTQLKVDRSFVQPVLQSENAGSLARGIVQMGLDLKLTVLAEGVETRGQFNFFRDCGCDQFQGFLFGRPMALADFERTATLSNPQFSK